jgi:DNA-binding transcriptional regulator of glucitol operon
MTSKINPDLITDDMMYEEISVSMPPMTHREQMLENQRWHDIRLAAKTDPVLQEALERVIILYQLSKEKYGTK